MTAAIMNLDTLAWAKKLERAGILSQHAEDQVALFAEVIEDNICTKKDLEVTIKSLELSLN